MGIDKTALRWYGRERGPLLLVFALFAGLFALVFALYGLSWKVAAYPALLCLLLGLVLLGLDFWHYQARHRQRQALRESIELNLDRLPPPETLAEAELGEFLTSLEALRSAQRSASLAREQESLDYYTAWVHQIKTPIAAMSLLLQTDEPPDRDEIAGQLFQIEEYVGMVLSYLRLGSETNDLVLRNLDLDSILRQAVRKYARLFIRKKLTLCYEPVGRRVLTDEKWLLFVVEQLLSNAIKYTPKGSVSLLVEGDELLVRDTGIGITPEDLPRIGEKGYTGYNGRVDKRSTGIGLYLCRQVLQKLGHSLRIESAPGVGTTVAIGLGRSLDVRD